MSDIVLDLKDYKLFDADSLKIDKKVSFVFGKNGTGKTTLTSLFQSQIENYDVRCFQGFDGIVGEDKKLNAVILGEENNEIDMQIKILEKEISDKEKSISVIEKNILQSDENPNNLWKDVSEKKKVYDDQKKKIDAFYSKSAKNIKNLSNPQVASPSYNTNKFQSEINKAKLLTDEEIKKHKQIIKTDVKTANKIKFEKIDFNSLLIETNSLLSMKVVEKEVIPEISGNPEKTRFAEKGLELHVANDRCSFCGNILSEDRYEKLKSYFSADEVKNLRVKINKHINTIDNTIQDVNSIVLDVNSFYSEYIEDINKIKENFKIKKDNVLSFLEELKNLSDNKLKELFEESKKANLNIPDSFEDEINQYNELVDKNNMSDLKDKKEKSKNELRYHEIKKNLNKFDYDNENFKINELKLEYEAKKNILEKENEKINDLKKEINNLKINITNLQAETKNEKILADEINKVLFLYVNFKLEYLKESDGEGYYLIKDNNTGEYRNITQLSSGEKNIIAFLYFIQKINEADNPKANLNKLVIFDDPMTSNDDTMQYVIIEELDYLIKNMLNKQDRILIMTHNNHFYLNMKYNYKSYKENIFLRLLSDGIRTKIVRLTKEEEDFKTNYESLWNELEFIYNNAPSEAMLLNPIRRIIETFTKFNSINKKEMFAHVSGAAKLFNVNSHSIDDLVAELNGRSKKDIMKIMKKCFEDEHALNHFNNYWKIDLE